MPPPARPQLQRQSTSGKTLVAQRNSGTCQRLLRESVIDPRTNKYIAYWDLVTTAGLVFTALVTPVEVAFLAAPSPAERWSDPLFLINRSIDCIFITDMILQLRIAYASHTADGMVWVLNSGRIMRHYVTSAWFALDLFSVLTSLFDILGDESTEDLKALRAVRAMRLIKLVKLARGSRIFKRWEMRMSINYSFLTLAGTVIGIAVSCHWVACVWGLQATFNPMMSWLALKDYCVDWQLEAPPAPWNATAARIMRDAECPKDWTCQFGSCDAASGVCVDGYACAGALEQYAYALYFAVMTVTSVGYGDVSASQFNVTEQFICVLIMLLTGMLWGYLIGIFCTMAALSPTVQSFRDEMSDLNSFMNEHKVVPEMRFRLREYMHQTVHLRMTEARRELLTKLSPAMQGEMSLLINQKTIGRVWYLANVEIGLLIHLSSKLQPAIFPPTEFCPGGFLYILERGMVIYAGRSKRQGTIWGEDVLLNNTELECGFPAVAVSYTWVLACDGKTLTQAIAMFPASRARLDFVRRRWAVRRCIVREAELIKFSRVPRENFLGRMYPIYAKGVAKRMKKERQEQEARLEALDDRETQKTRNRSPSPVPCTNAKDRTSSAGKLMKKSTTRKLSKAEAEGQALQQKHARAATMAAASEYGMQMRIGQMLKSAQSESICCTIASDSQATSRSASTSGGGGRRASCHGEFTSLPPAHGLAGKGIGAAVGAPSVQFDDDFDVRIKNAVMEMLPEIASAVATAVATKVARVPKKAKTSTNLLADAGGTERAPKAMRTRSRPARTRDAPNGAGAAVPLAGVDIDSPPQCGGGASNSMSPVGVVKVRRPKARPSSEGAAGALVGSAAAVAVAVGDPLAHAAPNGVPPMVAPMATRVAPTMVAFGTSASPNAWSPDASGLSA